MRKYLFLLLTFFVIGTISSLHVNAEETSATEADTTETSVTKTPRAKALDKKMMSMTALEEKKTARMEAIDAMKEKSMAAREEFKEKMKEIKDARKQKALTNLDSRISEMNKKRTTQMNERLERFTQIISKINSKEAVLKAAGKDTTNLVVDITSATTAIDAAKAAVEEQAAKDYLVEVTTEETLKSKASITIKEFMTDIKAVHQKVIDAQKAVVKASRNIGQLEGKSIISPSPTPIESEPTDTITP